MKQIPTPNDLAAELAAIKRATRELHETIKEAKQVRKDLLRAVEAISPTVDELISREVADGLTKYQDSLQDAIEKAQRAIYKRFDSLVDILLGENWKQRKHGNPTIPEMLEARGVTPQQHDKLEQWRNDEPDSKN